MNLYTAIVLRDMIREFIESGSWKGAIDDTEVLDNLFETYSFLEREIQTVLVNTEVVGGNSLHDILVFKKVLVEKMGVLKEIMLNKALSGKIEEAEDTGKMLPMYEDKLLKLSDVITKALASKEIKAPGLGKD